MVSCQKCMVYCQMYGKNVPPTVWFLVKNVGFIVQCMVKMSLQLYGFLSKMYGLLSNVWFIYVFFCEGFVFVGESWKESNGDLGSVFFFLGDGTIILWFNHNWTEGVLWLNIVLFKQHWLLLSIQTLP